MKKIIGNILKISFLVVFLFSIKVYAQTLDDININLSKTIVKPGENVEVNIEFGESLGAYTFEISYDNNIFEYVSVDGGTANDTGDKVIVVFYDSTGGNSPRNNMRAIFKAKSSITTSNPTNFSITAEGLANSDGTVTYDDITVPIVKNITVEPDYIDYTINLETTGEIMENEDKSMILSFSSTLGKYYAHARIIGSAITPEGGNVTLIGKDSAGLDHDIIQSGWGDASGFEIGGKDYSQVLSLKSNFSKAGNYKITISLIDRDNSDSIIAQKIFSFDVVEKNEQSENITTNDNNTENNTENNDNVESNENTVTNISDKNLNTQNNLIPAKLPKTGIDIFVPGFIIFVSVIALVIYFNKIR